MSTLTMDLDGLTCDMCVKHITEDLSELDGVDTVVVERGENLSALATVKGSALPDDTVLVDTVKEAGNYCVKAIHR